MPALAETEKMIKRRLKELTRTIDERFLSLRVDLNVLTKKSENAEVRERHLSATLESALELLHNVVRNRYVTSPRPHDPFQEVKTSSDVRDPRDWFELSYLCFSSTIDD
jgi:hypothetical protein